MNEITDFDLDLYTNDEHVITKIYKFLLKMNTEDKYVKDYITEETKTLVTTQYLNKGSTCGVRI